MGPKMVCTSEGLMGAVREIRSRSELVSIMPQLDVTAIVVRMVKISTVL